MKKETVIGVLAIVILFSIYKVKTTNVDWDEPINAAEQQVYKNANKRRETPVNTTPITKARTACEFGDAAACINYSSYCDRTDPIWMKLVETRKWTGKPCRLMTAEIHSANAELRHAIVQGNLPAVRAAFRRGAQFQIVSSGHSILGSAIFHRVPEIAEEILKLDTLKLSWGITGNGKSPLQVALEICEVKSLELLNKYAYQIPEGHEDAIRKAADGCPAGSSIFNDIRAREILRKYPDYI